VLSQGSADAALIASMTHYGNYTIAQIKDHLHQQGIKVRRRW
jgi:cyclase